MLEDGNLESEKSMTRVYKLLCKGQHSALILTWAKWAVGEAQSDQSDRSFLSTYAIKPNIISQTDYLMIKHPTFYYFKSVRRRWPRVNRVEEKENFVHCF